ncbi:hypothetical protein BDZ94DRAFT_1158717 [Collybia nuda]|uniref:Cryptic loci regulator 2 N-terminal domain-containing protein n=1 Tax=Collybia nuda TaxID=64659 RepID=A0A9P5YB93_9AGAR|nr:hypothetical protein BDZ94DRAFT_1158717 [Collybia nuda]
MSARRISDKPVSVPENATFLEFERSDGDRRTWPTNTTPIVDSEGHVNFMQPVDLESSSAIRWRIGAGQGAAVALERPAGPNYVLKDWPEGYRLFDHHKGPEANPRHDLYMFGSSNRRFRSINEFLPHAIWLLKDPTMNPSNCQCKYCSKKTQKEVTASLPGILRSTTGSQSPTPSRPRARDRPKTMRETAMKNNERHHRDPRVYAAVQRIPKPVISKSTHVSNRQAMLVERNSDLRAVHSRTEMRLKRWFRTGELLWCSLDPPIVGSNSAINFWPGLVEETRLKTKPIPLNTTVTTGGTLTYENEDNRDKTMEHTDPSVTWRVEQSTVYKMQLLGVSHSILLNDTQVLPYQAHVPPSQLIDELRRFPVENLNFNRESLAKYNPCPPGRVASFADGVAPYALAVQMASAISGYWCPTDEWAFNYTAPPKISPQIPINDGLSTLQAALEAASRHNSQPSSSVPLPAAQSYRNISGPDAGMSPEELQKLADRVIGKQVAGASLQALYSQIRFQGLWWGAERIWIDDFVRIKVPRRSLAPKGAENIYPPSGPGKEALEAFVAQGLDPSEIGAGSRGVFMRLDGLFIVDAVQPGGHTKKECRASGMLYELADEDWEDPQILEKPELAPKGSASQPVSPKGIQPQQSSSNVHLVPGTLTQITQKPVASMPVTQLSKPSISHYHLPAAPIGYRFRQILPDDHEAVFSLGLISGRYYPRILSHPLLSPTLHNAMANPQDPGGLAENDHLWALEGLSGGFRNSIDPTQHKISRIKMIEDADKIAISDLETHKSELMEAAAKEDSDSEMQMDDLAYPDSMDVDVV